MESIDWLPFSIAFDARDEEELIERWRTILRSNRWSEGAALAEFEEAWSAWNQAPALAFNNWTGAALAALDFIDVKGARVLCPSNTFLATPRSVEKAGGEVVFYDCNRHDLCGSFDDFVAKAEQAKPKAAWIVHIGGHIAFDIEKIAAYCKAQGIHLLEDCAHAAGAHWHGKRPGTWGAAGIFSFYATKTISLGEGGIAVSTNPEMVRHMKSYRDYGRGSQYRIQGMNYRMTEFTAAMGVVQTRRMEEIVAWKRAYAKDVLEPRFTDRVVLPDGMESGYYKFIVFEPVEKTSGKVYELPCHRLMKHDVDLPNTDWVAENHWCPPIYFPREGNSE